MKPTRRRVAALALAGSIAAACLLAACGSASPSAGPTRTVTVTVPGSTSQATTPAQSPTPAGSPGCATSVLKLSLGTSGAAAGSSYYPIDFTNTSGAACTLYGYPGVSFISASGSQIGAAAIEDPVYPRQLVTLAPGATAHADLQVTDALNYPAATCSPVSVNQLKVFPPGQTSPLNLGLTTTACASTSVQILAIQTVQPGS